MRTYFFDFDITLIKYNHYPPCDETYSAYNKTNDYYWINKTIDKEYVIGKVYQNFINALEEKNSKIVLFTARGNSENMFLNILQRVLPTTSFSQLIEKYNIEYSPNFSIIPLGTKIDIANKLLPENCKVFSLQEYAKVLYLVKIILVEKEYNNNKCKTTVFDDDEKVIKIGKKRNFFNQNIKWTLAK